MHIGTIIWLCRVQGRDADGQDKRLRPVGLRAGQAGAAGCIQVSVWLCCVQGRDADGQNERLRPLRVCPGEEGAGHG